MRIALSLLALLACDRPSTLVICHNSNCAEPTDPENDDSIAALTESLALEVDGVPAIDGTEVDLFWRVTDDTCIFAHDLVNAKGELASEAATVIATHLAAPGGKFHLFIEAKDFVDAAKTVHHTPEQRRLHARCVWDFYKSVSDAALANGRDLDVFIASFGPEMLKEIIAQTPPSLPFPVRYEAFYGIPRPLDSETRPLSDYAGIPITFVEMHSQWINDAQYEGLISSGIDVGFFMFSATEEHFAAIRQYEPIIVNTSEARLMRRWLAR
jgi:hypothetical protein